MSKLKSDPFKTVLVIVAGFIIIYAISIYYANDWSWALYIAIIVSILSIASKKMALLIEKAWFLLAKLLSKIIPNIILGLVFYLFLFPISLLSKLFGNKDSMSLKNPTGSVFKERKYQFTPDSFKNPW
jgi:hypothetical protein